MSEKREEVQEFVMISFTSLVAHTSLGTGGKGRTPSFH